MKMVVLKVYGGSKKTLVVVMLVVALKVCDDVRY